MQYKRYIPVAWVLLFTTFALTFAATPASATQRVVARSLQNQATTALTANVYLTTGTLAPIFQSRINQQVPGAVSSAISNIVSKLPSTDQGWAGQMATTLIQPSATLSSLIPQQNGLAAKIRISLYPGDPQPINASMLVGFAVRSGSSVQVSAQPMNGSPALVSGPLTTLSIPIGHLNSIHTTPSCGSAALAVNLQVPLSLGQNQASTNVSTGLTVAQAPQHQRAAQAGTSSYVEIPASSLASLGASIGALQVSKDMTARNISIAVQGGELVITSDIYFGFLQIASATTYVQPVATNGNLGVKVLKTDLTFLQLFTFPNNSYNQQIQQTLNAKLNGALAGKFYATGAAIGSNSQVPCAANDSLILTGNTSLI